MDNQVHPDAHDMWKTILPSLRTATTLLVNNLIILIAMRFVRENCIYNLVMCTILKRKLAIDYPSKNYT